MRHKASNYIFNFLTSREWNLSGGEKLLSADIRLVYGGNRRYLPIDLEASIEQHDEVLDASRAYTSRYPDYLRVDIKFTYQINKISSSHEIYLAADNFTNFRNVFYKSYNDGKIKTYYQFGIFPYLAYRISF